MDKTKKILFIISNLHTGGVSKSMTSLLNTIDRARYDVSLMLVNPAGVFLELLPQDLHIITNPVWSMLNSRLDGCIGLLKARRPLLALGHIIRLVISVFSKSKAAEMIARMMPALDETYDCIVDFNGQQQLYYMVLKLKATRKITFFHSDYTKWPYYYPADKKNFAKADYIFTISETCAASLRKMFPSQASKVQIMENISSLPLIERMAASDNAEEIDTQTPSIVSIGHVCKQKGIDLAIETANILTKKGLVFKWYFIGTVDSLQEYNSLISQKNLSDRILFLGTRVNPYPYIKKANIVAHLSRYEGKSIALDEAKLLCKPIVVTNFSTVNDQFTNRHNATICEMNPHDIAEAIEELLKSKSLQDQYKSTLLTERHDNSSEIEKLYHIFDD